MLTKSIKKASETSHAITSINKNLDSVKTNIESKIEEEGEAKAKMQKANNICLFNIPESSSNDQETSDKDDVIKLQEIFQNRLDIKKEDIKLIRRVPVIKPSESRKHPRPVNSHYQV